MSRLSLNVLGEVQVVLHEQPIMRWPTDKVYALLIYLAVERRPHRRSDLAAFFWPGYSEESAANSLRVALYQLRLVLGDATASPPWLLTTRGTIELNGNANVPVDALTFTELLTENSHSLAALQQAAVLYRGDFLTNFAVDDSTPFEEWRRLHQEQLHIQALDLLQGLADAAETLGDDQQTQHYAQRQLELEPWSETAHRQLMRSLTRTGAHQAALAQYQLCRQILATELGGEPSAATTELYEQIRMGRFPAKLTDSAAQPMVPLPNQAIPHNLPSMLTPLIGRAREVTEIIARLQEPQVRLLTLVGAGGMGKTRLALAVGETMVAAGGQPLAHFADGIFFVSLVPLTTSAALVPTLIATLGLEMNGDRQGLLQFLRNKRLLLILDNFEHLLTAGGLVAELLQGTPGLQILATSREPLNVRGEYRYPVQGLDYGQHNETANSAAHSASVELFLQSAERTPGAFDPPQANMAAILRICQFVQGMPLGLEMAAAWTAMLPVEEIADEIERSTDFLAVDWQDAPVRQRSMRALIEWSWRLLEEAEQRALRQLALFTGSFTRAAAEGITGTSLRILTNLLNKSLVQYARVSEEAGQPLENSGTLAASRRYELHRLVHQFAAEQLNTTDERLAAEARYSRFYLSFIVTRQARLLGNEVREAGDEIQAELDNIRQAWRWAIQQGQWDLIAAAAYCLSEFFSLAGLSVESEQSFQLAVDECARQWSSLPSNTVDTQALQRTWSQLLAAVTTARYRQGKLDAVVAPATQAIQLAAASGTLEAQVQATYAWAVTLSIQGNLGEAYEHFANLRTMLEQANKRGATSTILADFWWRYYLGMFSQALLQGNHAEAEAYGAAGLQSAQEIGALRGQIILRLNLTELYLEVEAYGQARQEADLTLTLAKRMGYHWGECAAFKTLGRAHSHLGNFSLALQSYEQARRITQEIGEISKELEVAAYQSQLYMLLGNPTLAQALLQTWQQSRHEGLSVSAKFTSLVATLLVDQFEDKLPQAYQAATQVWQLASDTQNPRLRAQALVYRGQVQMSLQQWMEATASYQQALSLCLEVAQPALATEARAGLAQIALAQDKVGAAQTWVEAILPALATQPPVGVTTVFSIYLTCYRVLRAGNDARALPLLQAGHDLMQRALMSIHDEALRRSFLDNVASHRALHMAYLAEINRRSEPVVY